MSKVKEENIVFLTISTFVGTGVGAVHYYGRLTHLQLCGDFDVIHKLTQIEADRFNKDWRTKSMRESLSAGYQKGEESSRFFSEALVIVAAKKQFKKCFPKAAVLVLGRASFGGPQKILVGPKEFKNAINVLARAYDKLDWDTKADRKEITELEKKWEELWPRKCVSIK